MLIWPFKGDITLAVSSVLNGQTRTILPPEEELAKKDELLRTSKPLTCFWTGMAQRRRLGTWTTSRPTQSVAYSNCAGIDNRCRNRRLEQWIRAGSTPQQVVLRARIIVAAARGPISGQGPKQKGELVKAETKAGGGRGLIGN